MDYHGWFSLCYRLELRSSGCAEAQAEMKGRMEGSSDSPKLCFPESIYQGTTLEVCACLLVSNLTVRPDAEKEE